MDLNPQVDKSPRKKREPSQYYHFASPSLMRRQHHAIPHRLSYPLLRNLPSFLLPTSMCANQRRPNTHQNLCNRPKGGSFERTISTTNSLRALTCKQAMDPLLNKRETAKKSDASTSFAGPITPQEDTMHSQSRSSRLAFEEREAKPTMP